MTSVYQPARTEHERIVPTPLRLPVGELIVIEGEVWRVVEADGIRTILRLELSRRTVDILH